jgi:uncharacterized Fe-S center protein
MPVPVYYGSAKCRRLRADETLPAKLDRILDRLAIRDRVKGETVAIKMHLGGHIGYTTVHPVFVRKIVQAVKDGGGTPFVTDTPHAATTAYQRGYTQETLGCPILPAAGLTESYFYAFEEPYKNITTWKVAGQVADASFLIDLAHAKGHPSCSYGGAIKNLALGCQVGAVRSQLHDTCHYDQYWFPEKCPDPAVREAIIAACPRGALSQDTQNPDGIHLHFEPCNACGRCMQVAPDGALQIKPVNFHSFQEACAVATKQTLRTFDRAKQVFLILATEITPLCDCFGMSTEPILPNIGILGADDICAVEQATLDQLGRHSLIRENIPEPYEVQDDLPHPLQQLHGRYKDPYIAVRACEALGLGSTDYTLVDVMDDATAAAASGHISAAHM